MQIKPCEISVNFTLSKHNTSVVLTVNNRIMETKLLNSILSIIIVGSLLGCQSKAQPKEQTQIKQPTKVEAVKEASDGALENQIVFPTYANVKEQVAQTKKTTKLITPEELKELRKTEPQLFLIDVRDKEESNLGKIPGATQISRGLLEFRIAKDSFWEPSVYGTPTHDALIVLYCRSDGRGALAAQSLQNLNYTNVLNLEGGFRAWEKLYPKDIEIPSTN